MNYESHIQKLESFISKEISIDELTELFYFPFMDDEIESQFDNNFSEICEKMDFTDENLDTKSRKDGWIETDEFRVWLNDYLIKSGIRN